MIETRRTFCRICYAACPLDVDVETGGDHEMAVAVRGVPSDPLFQGYTCIKGRHVPEHHHSPQRLRTALRRQGDGTFAPVSSSAALDDIADRIGAIVEAHGQRAVATYTGTGAYQNALSLPAAVAFHAGLGSPSLYTSVTIDQPAHVTSRLRLGSWEAGWHNFSDADVNLAIGYNPLVSSYAPVGGLQGTNPIVSLRRAKARGMKLIVVDPRRSEFAAFADIWLPVRPGEDPTLLSGLIRVILAEELYDRPFCERWVGQLDALRAAVEPFTPEMAAERCGVPVGDLIAAARLFAAGPRGAAGTGTGPNMAPHSTLTEHLTLALNALCGRVNRAGDLLESGYFTSPGDTRRAQVVAPSNPTPGTPHRVKGLHGLPGEMLSACLAEEILEPGSGQVRALIVCGGNPVVAFPDQRLTIEAMKALELLVVIDHRMTPSADLAHYVIPARLQLERADLPLVMDRRFVKPYVNYSPVVLEPHGDVLSEWEVFAGIAARIGTTMPMPGGPLPLDCSDDEIVLDHAFALGRMPMDEIRDRRGTVVEDRAIRVVEADAGATARFAVAPPDVVAELAEVLAESTGSVTLAGFDAERYPFRLISRRLKHVLNSQGRETPGLARVGSTNFAYLHPDDLSEIGVSPGELVEITSPSGSIVGVAEASETLSRGVVSMSHSWGGAPEDDDVRRHGVPTNRLCTVSSGYDRLNGMAVQSAIPVAVRPASTPPDSKG